MRCFYGDNGGHETLLVTVTSGVPHCSAHSVPDWPERDKPIRGRCIAGHVDNVWTLPKTGEHVCRKHLGRILRVATWPKPIRVVPEDDT